jgi:two-component system, response regulator RegA
VSLGRTILVVDDDDPFRRRLARALRDRGHEPVEAASATEALALARTESPEWAVVDLRIPGVVGLGLVKALREIDPATRIVILSGYGAIATAVEAMRLGAHGFLAKPADADDVIAAFDDAPAAAAVVDDREAPSLARAEWEHIQRILADCAGNVSEAARRLGLHRRSLQRKLQKRPPAH